MSEHEDHTPTYEDILAEEAKMKEETEAKMKEETIELGKRIMQAICEGKAVFFEHHLPFFETNQIIGVGGLVEEDTEYDYETGQRWGLKVFTQNREYKISEVWFLPWKTKIEVREIVVAETLN